jgi:hypothetical protein
VHVPGVVLQGASQERAERTALGRGDLVQALLQEAREKPLGQVLRFVGARAATIMLQRVV